MFFRITSDTNEESGVSKVVEEISGPANKYFKDRYYGEGFSRLAVVLMCRDPELNFKRRIRYSKKDKTLYMDIMLNLSKMMSLSHDNRRNIIVSELIKEVPSILSKYNFDDFNYKEFEHDLHAWFISVGA